MFRPEYLGNEPAGATAAAAAAATAAVAATDIISVIHITQLSPVRGGQRDGQPRQLWSEPTEQNSPVQHLLFEFCCTDSDIIVYTSQGTSALALRSGSRSKRCRRRGAFSPPCLHHTIQGITHLIVHAVARAVSASSRRADKHRRGATRVQHRGVY